MEITKFPIGYARTSTKEQGIELQINQLKTIAIPAGRIFFDAGVSGVVPAPKRIRYKQLLSFTKDNQVDAIYCFEISRLGRTAMETLILVQDWENAGIRIISLSPAESWSQNVDRLFRELLLHMLAWVANMERKVLKERLKAGVAEYKNKHGRWGKSQGNLIRRRLRKCLEKV